MGALKLDISEIEIEQLYREVELLTGNCQQGHFRREVVLTNVIARMKLKGINRLSDYLYYTRKNKDELDHFLSAITIHTTSWFREVGHYQWLEANLKNLLHGYNDIFKIASIPCSTGEEVYSIAAVLEAYRMNSSYFKYRIDGFDIDPHSIEKAKNAIYKQKLSYNLIPQKYRKSFMLGSGPTEGLFTTIKEIRSNCFFDHKKVEDFIESGERYNVIFCRNLLIYYDEYNVKKIVNGLKKCLQANGVLILGMSEAITNDEFSLESVGPSIYRDKKISTKVDKSFDTKVSKEYKILAIDDSRTIRKIISDTLNEEGYVVDTAYSVQDANIKLEKNKYDLITLDLNLPVEKGDDWLRKFRQVDSITPVIIVSDSVDKDTDKVIRLLNSGLAQDSVSKGNIKDLGEMGLLQKVEAFKDSPKDDLYMRERLQNTLKKVNFELICIGASTGGPQALKNVLRDMPGNTPPIVITQHIDGQYSHSLLESIANYSNLKIGVIEHGEILKSGHIYMAKGDYHIGVKKSGSVMRLIIDDKALPINHHRPSVDFLFNSIAKFDSRSTLAILLTGMGKDGAEGMKLLYDNGAQTIAQDASSSVVFGMPRRAIELGAVTLVAKPDEIRKNIISTIVSE